MNLTTISPDDTLAEARERLTEATAAHQAAREASDAARATLAAFEAAADRGEEVDTATFTTAKADLSLKSRRTAALSAQIAEAQEAVDQAQEAVYAARLTDMAATLPSLDKPRQKAVKAFEDYLAAVRAQDDAVRELYAEAKGLPDFPHGKPGQEKATGWPAYATSYQGQWKIEGRLGHVLIDGKPIKRPDLTREAERLAEELVRQARTR
ncbi:hypothetical protein [Kocuria turfanensis]|uniref:Uncharacterized protein n=1 Tax=Kocuria turfanensis TaxID=388357 RepID=A0A512IC03_9MICC|nr:hypothetical protein [Kocuria turfanensis]GEO95224.1 hypothetical protein KTU01_13470 [Kocuria turfanensis]